MDSFLKNLKLSINFEEFLLIAPSIFQNLEEYCEKIRKITKGEYTSQDLPVLNALCP